MRVHQPDRKRGSGADERRTETLTRGLFPAEHVRYKPTTIRRIPNAAAPVDTQLVNGYYLLGNHPQHFIRDQTLLDCIFVKSGDRYLQRDFDYSIAVYNR